MLNSTLFLVHELSGHVLLPVQKANSASKLNGLTKIIHPEIMCNTHHTFLRQSMK